MQHYARKLTAAGRDNSFSFDRADSKNAREKYCIALGGGLLLGPRLYQRA